MLGLSAGGGTLVSYSGGYGAGGVLTILGCSLDLFLGFAHSLKSLACSLRRSYRPLKVLDPTPRFSFLSLLIRCCLG